MKNRQKELRKRGIKQEEPADIVAVTQQISGSLENGFMSSEHNY